MSLSQRNNVGPRPRETLGDAGFSGVIFRALANEPDVGVLSLAARLGWPEESLRGYRDGKASPPFDRLVATFRRPTAPPGMLFDALQTLAGPRALVALVDNRGVPAGAKPADVVREMIEALCGFQVLLQETYERAADGVICAGDCAAIAKGWSDVRGLGEQAVRFAQHCAANAGRNR